MFTMIKRLLSRAPDARVRDLVDEQEEEKKEKLECVRKGKCPDCGAKDKILAGPRGGLAMNVNVKCEACGSEFNINPFRVERI